MTGTLIDCGAIILGSVIGMLIHGKVNSEEMGKREMQALALCAFLVGICGCLDVSSPIIAILSIVIGGAVGNLLQLERWLVWLLNKGSTAILGTRMSEKSIEGFRSYSMLSIVGSMAVVGAIKDGLTGDITTLLTKAAIDGVCAVIFGATFGGSVMLSVLVVAAYQGIFSLLAAFLNPLITPQVLGDMTAVGSVMIFCVGFNLLNISNVKTMNLVPAIFLPIVFHLFM